MLLPVCNWDGHVWPRKKHLFYVAWGEAQNFQRYRLRFCTPHALLVDEHLAENELSPTIGAVSTPYTRYTKCLACREPTGEVDWQVFITGYPAQDERKDYWGCLHVGCTLPAFLCDPHFVPAT